MGLAVTHYGTFIIFLTVFFSIYIHQLLVDRCKKLIFGGLVLLPAVALFLIRLGFLTTGVTWGQILEQAQVANSVGNLASVFSISLSGAGSLCFLLGATGFVIYIRKHKSLLWILAVFISTVVMLYLIQYGIYKTLVVNPSNLIIIASIPMALFCGTSIDSVVTYLKYGLRGASGTKLRVANLLTASMLVIFTMSTLVGSGKSLNPLTVTFLETDRDAIQWMDEHLPGTSKILINAFHWNDRLVPSDGGGWIEALIGRETDIPLSGENLDDYIKEKNIRYYYTSSGNIEYDSETITALRPFLIFSNERVNLYQFGY